MDYSGTVMDEIKNPFLPLIRDGKITTSDELKKVYRRLLKETHPDKVGSEERLDLFLQLESFYKEALEQFSTAEKPNKAESRLQFYKALLLILDLESRLKLSRKEVEASLERVAKEVTKYWEEWQGRENPFFYPAFHNLVSFLGQTGINDLDHLREPSLFRTIAPVLYKICAYHISAKSFYIKQINRGFILLEETLKKEGQEALLQWILFLLQDAQKGPAIFS